MASYKLPTNEYNNQASTGPVKISSGPSGSNATTGPGGQPQSGAQTGPGVSQGPSMPTTVGPYSGAQTQGQGGNVQQSGVGTGYVNLQNILSANAPQAQSMANGLAAQAAPMAQPTQEALARSQTQARQGLGYTQVDQAGAQKASDYANSLNNYGGLAQQLQQKATGQYNEGENALDTFLTGNAGQSQFAAAQKAYGGLADQVAAANAQTYQKGVNNAALPGHSKAPQGVNYRPGQNPNDTPEQEASAQADRDAQAKADATAQAAQDVGRDKLAAGNRNNDPTRFWFGQNPYAGLTPTATARSNNQGAAASATNSALGLKSWFDKL